MPIVQREPTIVKREIRLEQPVNELLDNYAKFIESRPGSCRQFSAEKDALKRPRLQTLEEPADRVARRHL